MTDARDVGGSTADALPDGLETDLQMARISTGLFEGKSQPARLGRFVVLDRIGSGAMGTVLAAYDPQLDRSVAIKVLRTEAGERDPGAVTRLDREARTLAKLNHPNVVAVHEVGTTAGQMFVAMEMVDGGDLAGWLAERPDPSTRFAEALELVCQAGRGLSAAHQAGVVHRDFKPANILIGTDGRVRVADFGLARMGTASEQLESRDDNDDGSTSASVTQTGAVVGTPAYMAPEQRDGQPADALADQYSFCVTAWEALFGPRPSLKATVTVPLGANSRARSVAAALKRGLSADRTARFEDMATLVGMLALNPVKRRRRIALGALTVVASGAAVTGYNLERSSRCDAVAEPVEAIWNVARRDALEQGFAAVEWAGTARSWDRFSEDADAYVKEWTTAVQTSCRAARIDQTLDEQVYQARSACFEDRLARFAGVLDVYTDVTRDLVVSPFSLSRALGPLQTCIDRPRPVSHSARPLMTKLGRGLGILRAGNAAKGAQILEQVNDEAQTRGLPLVQVQARAALAEAQEQLGAPQQSVATRQEAYWMALEYGDDALAARLAARLAFRLASTRDLDAAERWLKPAAVLGARAGLGPDERSNLEGSRARVALARGDMETALAHFEQSHRLAIAAWGPDHPRIVASEKNLAQSLARRRDLAGALDRAIELAEHALEVRIDHFGQWHPDVARSHMVLGGALGMHQRPSEAIVHFARAAEILTESYGHHHRQVAFALTSLGQATQALGDEAGAEPYYRQALEILAKVASPDETQVLTARMNLGRSLISNGRCEEALPSLNLVADALAQRSAKDPRLAITRWMIGACLVRLGRHDAAKQPLEAARDAFEGRANDQGSILIVLARMHRSAGQIPAGLAVLGRVSTLLGGNADDDDPLVRAEALTVQAWLYLDQGEPSTALAHARESVAIYRSAPVSAALRVSGWGEAARVLLAAGAPDEAKATALEAHRLIDAPEVASKLAPALTVDLYLALAGSTAATDPAAAKAWAQRALLALEDTDASYDTDRRLARSLADAQ